METRTLLIIGHVWAEPTSSAAGWRILALAALFRRNNFEVIFASSASRSPHSADLASLGISELDILLNDSSFDRQIREIQPDIVLFDRFIVEEQFGARVTENCPGALRILDTEDLHFLRKARQEAFKKGADWNDDMLYSEVAKREIASIYRCDLSLIISKTEYDILLDKFKIPVDLLEYVPFFGKEEIRKFKPYEERANILFIGNFLHEPNWQTVRQLKTVFWPKISKLLPKAELHIYGAYPTEKVFQLHREQERFLIKGRAEDAVSTLSDYRLLLAPIPFGAGQKGKLIDAMLAGTPFVTTPVGIEGMSVDRLPGIISELEDEIIRETVRLYQDASSWNEKQEHCLRSYKEITFDVAQQQQFMQLINLLTEKKEEHRQSNFVGQILQSQLHHASKYMSMWIEEKNKRN